MQTFKPNALLVVPRVLEKVYNAADATAGSGIKLRIFRLAARTAEHWARLQESGKEITFAHKIKIALARKLVLNKIRKLLGGNLQGIVSGGAPMAERLGRFFIGCGIEVLQGYGATETTGPLTMSERIGNKTGYVGQPLLCNEVRLGEGGELQARGGSIMRGYHGEPELTKEAFTGGRLVQNRRSWANRCRWECQNYRARQRDHCYCWRQECCPRRPRRTS